MHTVWLSWVNAVDLPDNLIDSPAYGEQEKADVRAVLARVRELRASDHSPKDNHWVQAREEFIERVLAEAGVVFPKAVDPAA